jgi:tetratricopeptide (TPR) repeat protein
MGFAGNLNTLSLVEVFQTINRIRATGVLRLAAVNHGRDVVFADGEIIGVRFRAGEEKLGLLRRLILERKIDASAASNISTSKKDSHIIIQGLIEKGQLSADDAAEATQRQAEDELYNICTWDFADFVFHDATPEAPDIQDEVNACRQTPLSLKVNSVLMEAARRMDEWERLRKVVTSEEVVLGPAENREQELLAASQEYPGSAVVPLIDAVRTVESIIKESVATRLDVYSVVADLFKNGLLAVLSRDDIIAHGDYQLSSGDFRKAAELYRRAVSEDPADRTTNEKLANALEKLGEQPEAAGCFAQLALGYLDEGDGRGALSSAHRAVRLANDDPVQRMILVRCLLDTGDQAGAVNELQWIVGRYVELGQLEDARGTCLKILELDPQNEATRREIARIFATAEGDTENEDVVVCVQCGHVNHREATTCKECSAPLRLSCQSCSRTVAVSDRICIFCGANPHSGGQKKLLGSPATTRIVNKSVKGGKDAKSESFWKNQLEGNVKKARALEEEGDYSGALDLWREIAKVNQDNKELLTHIRELESRISDDQAEKFIERGHQLRRARRFAAALKCYRSAIRTIPENDPRHPRLKDIVAATAKDNQRILIIYSAAFVMIGILGWLVARPYLLFSTFKGDLGVTRDLLSSMPPGASPATFATFTQIGTAITQLEESTNRLGTHNTATEARTQLNAFRGEVMTARVKVAEQALADIDKAIQAKDMARADQLLMQLRAPEFREGIGPRFMHAEQHVAAAKKMQADIATRIKEAPTQMETAQGAEKQGDLLLAINIYRSVAELNIELSAKAKQGVERLQPAEKTFTQAFEQAQDLVAKNPAQAEKMIAAIIPEAKKWGKASDVQTLQHNIATRLQTAATAYQQLGAQPTVEALHAFMQQHVNTPQAAQAKLRLDQLQQAQRSREELITNYRTAMTNNQTEQAWRFARTLVASGAALPNDVRLPLRIESYPSGASVIMEGQTQGVTPCVIGVLPSQAQQSMQLVLDGWLPYEVKIGTLTNEWRAQLALSRKPKWQIALGKPINTLLAMPDGGVLALAGDALHHINKQGQSNWRVSVATDDELADSNKLRLPHTPLVMPDGGLIVGLPGNDLMMLDVNGQVQRRLATNDLVHGRAVLFTNDLLGGSSRMAFAAERLFVGNVQQEPNALELPSPALSGPIVFPRGPDRLIALATIQGQLIAFEDSSRKRLWTHDLKATEIGQLIPLSADSFACVLDGSRLSCFQISDAGLRVRWNVALPGPALGDPVVDNKAVWIAAGAEVVRVSLDGGMTSLPSGQALTTPVAAAGKWLAVGNKAQQLMVYEHGKPLWASQCSAVPLVVACTVDGVVVGLADGTLAAYLP